MGTILVYLIESGICLACMYLFYKLLLSRDTFHRFNRFFLLFILVFSAVIPAVSIGQSGPADKTGEAKGAVILDKAFLQGHVVDAEVTASGVSATTWADWALLVYLAGMAVFAASMVVSVVRMERFLSSCDRKTLPDGTKVRIAQTPVEPFSWMGRVCMTRSDWERNPDTVLAHEKAHISYMHSIDLMAARVIATVQWFNPAAWLMIKEFQTVHEYEADQSVIDGGCPVYDYQALIIEKAIGERFCQLANSLNNCSTKNRIIMMTRKPTAHRARMKALFAVPVATLLALSLTSARAENMAGTISDASVTRLFAADEHPYSKNVVIKVNADAMAAPDYVKAEIEGVETINEFSLSLLTPEGSHGILSDDVRKRILSYGDDVSMIAVYDTVKKVGFMLATPEGIASWNGTIDGDVIEIEEAEDNMEEEAFMVVEEMPQFPGGVEAMMKYLGDNIQYPEESKAKNEQGRVIVSFIVETDGSITNAEIVKSVSELLDAEALRVISSMPNWTPGTQRGQAVRVKYTIPITFQFPQE